jgi:hypothetical protein
MPEPTSQTPKQRTWTRRLGALVRWLHTYVSLLGFLALLFFAVTGFTLNHADWLYTGEGAIRQMQGRLDPGLLGVGRADAAAPPVRRPDPSPSDDLNPLAPAGEFGPPTPLGKPVSPPPLEEPAAPPLGEEFGAPALLEEPAAPPLAEESGRPEFGAPALLEEPAAPPPVEEFGAPPPVEEYGPLPPLQDPADAGVPTQHAGAVDKLAVAETLRSRHALEGSVAEFTVDPFQCIVSFQGPGYSADAFIDRATGEYSLTEMRRGLLAVLNDLHRGRVTGPAWSWVIDVSAAIMTIASITGLALLLFYRRRRRTGLVAALVGSVAVVLIYLFCVP